MSRVPACIEGFWWILLREGTTARHRGACRDSPGSRGSRVQRWAAAAALAREWRSRLLWEGMYLVTILVRRALVVSALPPPSSGLSRHPVQGPGASRKEALPAGVRPWVGSWLRTPCLGSHPQPRGHWQIPGGSAVGVVPSFPRTGWGLFRGLAQLQKLSRAFPSGLCAPPQQPAKPQQLPFSLGVREMPGCSGPSCAGAGSRRRQASHQPSQARRPHSHCSAGVS